VAEFTFTPRTGRFRDVASGRFVPETRVRTAVDATVDLSSERMGELAGRLRSGEITLAQFQAQHQAAIKDVHVANALAAYGGREQMDASKWGVVGQRIRTEYGYARQLVADVLDGKQPLNGRFDQRVKSYAQSGRVTFEAVRGRQRRDAGEREEMNVLHAAESCSSCKSQSARGWVQIGGLVPVGSRACRGNCRCTITYRGAGKSEAAA